MKIAIVLMLVLHGSACWAESMIENVAALYGQRVMDLERTGDVLAKRVQVADLIRYLNQVSGFADQNPGMTFMADPEIVEDVISVPGLIGAETLGRLLEVIAADNKLTLLVSPEGVVLLSPMGRRVPGTEAEGIEWGGDAPLQDRDATNLGTEVD